MASAAALADTTQNPARAIVTRTQGHRRGPITRLISPGDIGALLKPFVFLDLFEAERMDGPGFAPHPHSGIATLTTFLEGRMTYADTTGKRGALSTGAVEWMCAGRGVWHAGDPAPGAAMRGYQLWLALPPELELTPPNSLYLEPERIQSAGPARVLLGTYEGAVSPISYPVPLTYLHVRLAHGERWTYRPAPGHEIAWLAVNKGQLHTGGTTIERELVVFAEGDDSIALTAEGEVEFVIGSARRHPYPLVTGYYSVHTSEAALAEGERTIAELQRSPALAALKGH